MDDVKARVREFLTQHIRHDIADDEDFFAAGFVNSLFTMQLVMFVEKDLAVTVEDEDLELDNFRSIDAIAGFVTRKRLVGAVP